MLSPELTEAIGGCSTEPWINVGNIKLWAPTVGYVMHSWTGDGALQRTPGGCYAMEVGKFHKVAFRSKGEETKCVIAIAEAIVKRIARETQSSS